MGGGPVDLRLSPYYRPQDVGNGSSSMGNGNGGYFDFGADPLFASAPQRQWMQNSEGGSDPLPEDPDALQAWLDSNGYQMNEMPAGNYRQERYITDAQGNDVGPRQVFNTNDNRFLAAGLAAGAVVGGAVAGAGAAGSGGTAASTVSGGGITAGAGSGTGLTAGAGAGSYLGAGGATAATGTGISAGTGGAIGSAGVGAGTAGATGAGIMGSGIGWSDVIGAGVSLLNKPKNVDYEGIADKQGEANRQVNQDNLTANRPNVNTPMGQSKWTQIPDPNNPGGFTWTQDITLSPEQQAIYQRETANNQKAQDLGGEFLASTNTAPIDYSKFGQAQTMGQAPTPFALGGNNMAYQPQQQQRPNPSMPGGMGPVQQYSSSGQRPMGGMQQRPQSGQPTPMPGGQQQPFSMGGAGQQPISGQGTQAFGSPSYQAAPQAQRQQYQNVGSNAYGQQEMMQGNGPALGRSTAQAGLSELGGGPQYQTQQQGDKLQGLQGPQARDLYGQQGYESSRGQIQDALFQREKALLQPGMEQDSKSLDNQLRNQGLMPGTKAYDDALQKQRTQQSQTMADLGQRAILAGGAEQSRLAGIDLAADSQRFGQQQVGYGNQANAITGDFGMDQSRLGFNNQAGQSMYDNTYRQNQTNNAVRQQGFTNNQANDAYNRSGAQAEFQNYGAAVGQRNQARTAGLGNDIAAAGVNNQNARYSNNDFFDQSLTGVNSNNAARQQTYQDTLAGGRFQNESQNQQYGQNMQSAAFNNTVRQNAISEARTAQRDPLELANMARNGSQAQMPTFQPYGMSQNQAPNYQAAGQQTGQQNINNTNYWNGWAQSMLGGR